MYIVSTKASGHLAGKSGLKVLPAERKYFSDGNLYVRLLRPVRGKRVLVVGSVRTADDLLELLFLTRAVKENGGRPCVAVPYLGYSRADRPEQKGEPHRLQLVADALDLLGAQLRVFDIHQEHSLRLFKKAELISALPLLAGAFMRDLKDVRDIVVVAPDEGAAGRARHFARHAGARDILLLRKKRTGGKVHVHRPAADLRGRTAVLVDDILDTGATLFAAAKVLKNAGASRVYAAVVHGVFSQNALASLKKSPLERLYVTNSVYPSYRSAKIKVVDMSVLLGI